MIEVLPDASEAWRSLAYHTTRIMPSRQHHAACHQSAGDAIGHAVGLE